MKLQWTEYSPLGEANIREGYPVNTRNAAEYAKKNCRRCHGRGTELWDNGWSRINQRVLACDCVLRNLEKIQNAGK